MECQSARAAIAIQRRFVAVVGAANRAGFVFFPGFFDPVHAGLLAQLVDDFRQRYSLEAPPEFLHGFTPASTLYLRFRYGHFFFGRGLANPVRLIN